MHLKEKDYIFNADFLLQNKTARRLYHDYAEGMPILDYHNHLPVKQIAENYTFQNLTDIWLKGDHYKWRAMRTLGVEEKYITGEAADEEKFRKWAEVVPETLRNPLFHWTHLELKDPFGIEEYLHGGNADKVYKTANEHLKKPEFSTRGLLRHFKLTTVCTTDDPCDTLEYHKKIKESDFEIDVRPGFRPDNVFKIQMGDSFKAYINRLEEASQITIQEFSDLVKALKNRIQYFKELGGSISDHGLNYIPSFDPKKEAETNTIFKKALNTDKEVTPEEAEQFQGLVLFELCKIYHEENWVQQFHLGPFRNVNRRKLELLGPDTGFDTIGDYRQGQNLVSFLGALEEGGHLGKTILYNINPADNELFAALPGSFNEGPEKGKIQYGSAWWFHDQLDGMERQINALSNMGILSSFVGMLTDSRSFLSFSRHDYFRRLLCNIFGKDMENGLLPNDDKWIGKMIQDICYTNAKNYFGWK